MIELYSTVEYYGIGYIIKKYAGFPKFIPLPVSVQHGWDIAPNSHDARENAPENWYWSVEIEKRYQEQFPSVCTRTVGAPFLYLLELIKYSQLPRSNRQGSIVFPSHSSSLTEMVCDFDAYAEMLRGLPESYKPITVCLYHLDRDRGLDIPFLRRGFKVVTNGSNLYEQAFLPNFISNTKDKLFAFSNQMTSALLFSSVLGLKAFFFGPEFKANNNDPHWQHLDYNEYQRCWESKFKNYFAFPNCDLIKQRAFSEKELGKNSTLTSSQMRKLLWTLVFHKKYWYQLIVLLKGKSYTWARHVAKEFYRRCLMKRFCF